MTIFCVLFFLAPALFTLFVLLHSLVQIQMAEPVETVTLDRISVMRELLAKAAGAGLMLVALVGLIGCDVVMYPVSQAILAHDEAQNRRMEAFTVVSVTRANTAIAAGLSIFLFSF